jgi:tyrosyl-tRNA synthetase
MLMRRIQRAGHTPFVLLGGATGLIGDPSGKEAERALRTREEVQANVDAQRPIFERLLDFDQGRPNDASIVNNDDWFRSMDVYEWLRDVGKHFSVSQMIARDSVKNRLDREQGISYTEFSYMLLQAYDFLHLFREERVTMQTAGADQWGNIVSGLELVRRSELFHNETGKPKPAHFGQPPEGPFGAFGLTAPLITKADGTKFGKTERGAVWLTHKRPSGEPGTSPYAYYQFWLNASDEDAGRFLRIFTDLPLADIEQLEAEHAAAPHQRTAQRRLAREATTILHGADAMRAAEHAARALFSGDVRALDAETLGEVFAEVPMTTHDRSVLEPPGADPVELLVQTSLASSKSEARKHLAASAVSVNGEKISPDTRLTTDDLLHDRVLAMRRGKKNWHICRFG